jgi:DNA-binding CsgD family transcriptional regulator
VDLTRRQLEVVRVYVDAGGAKGAAYQLGVTPATIRATLQRARTVEGVATTSQLVAQLSKRGEL